jgi:hypothetical protein
MRAEAATNRFLHVANGHATTGTMHMAGIPGTSYVWADVLHEGPVPGGLSDEQLLKIRARYLTALSDGSIESSYEDTLADMNACWAAIENDGSYDELILWYEHDLFDQLNLIHVLSRIGRTLPRTGTVSLICIGSFPGRPDFKGLGELTPDELASLLETRQRVRPPQYSLAGRAWLAFRASDPRQLEDLLRADTSALPFLAAALQRHLEEFPWTIDGLSRTERRLMELAVPGPIDLWAAFRRMHDLETAFYIADASFWGLVHALASSSPALVSVDVTSRIRQPLPRGTISLTETGRAVLQGATDRVRRVGLDRWLGGVHLEGSEATWRWDAAERRIVHV